MELGSCPLWTGGKLGYHEHERNMLLKAKLPAIVVQDTSWHGLTSYEHSVGQNPPKKPASSCPDDISVSPTDDYVTHGKLPGGGDKACFVHHWILAALEEFIWFHKWVGGVVRNAAQHMAEIVTMERAGDPQTNNKNVVWWARDSADLDRGTPGYLPCWQRLHKPLDVFHTGIGDRPFLGFNFWVSHVLLWCYVRINI